MQSLLDFWFPTQFHQAFWFDGSKDKEIYDLFSKNLQDAEILDISFILSQDLETQYCYLILFDQITRNIARFENSNEYRNDTNALIIAQNLIVNNYDLEMSFLRRIFILLPLRHTNNIKYLDFVIEKLNSYFATLQDCEKKDYQKFYIASLKSYTKCNDNIQIQTNSSKQPIYDEEIHDDNCKNYTQIVNLSQNNNINTPLCQSIIKYCKKYKLKNIGVSLSGGVDSMVLLFLLKQMEINSYIQKVIAIHVDYNWRKESNKEASFLLDFCSQIDVDFVLRDVKHYNETVDKHIFIEREEVEDETKNIRFNTYKFAIEKYNLDGVCLGHHKGDLIENVFMNLSKGKNILNLFVTEEFSLQYNVNILRPMLAHNKCDIFDIAHSNNILYFKDTTPDWSFRGTMRRKIFPTMENFDSMILNNFYKIGQQSQEWGRFINKIIQPILKNSQEYNFGYGLEINFDMNDNPIAFWSEIFVNFFHSRGIKMITQKNLKAFYDWINLNNNSLFRLSNGFVCCKKETKLYFVRTELYERERLKLTVDNKYTHPNQIINTILQQ